MLNKNRILIVRRAYFPQEYHVRRNATALVEAGFEVDLICPRNTTEAGEEIFEGIHIYRLPLKLKRTSTLSYIVEYFLFALLAFLKLTSLFIRKRYGKVEIDSMPNFLVFSALIPKIAGSKVVLYLFESMPEIWAQKKEIPMDNTFIRVLCLEEKISCIFADHLIVCHTIAKEALVKRGIPGQKITVIMNVPDEKNFFAPAPPQKTENAGLRLVQHGTMTDNYGIQVVIKAVALLKDECQITYDVIGQGEYKEALYALAAGLGVEDRVNFRGFLPKEEMISVIQESDAGIVPMLFEYQSPNKMFEYFLFHKPVIASNRKTFLQYFDENEVIYFKTNDEEDLSRVLKYYYHHKDEFAAYASAAARRFSDYVWAKEKQKYTAVYKESEQIN